MMPEILLGCASYPALEHRGVLGDDAIDVRIDVAGRCRIDRLEGEAKAAGGLAERGAEYDRRAKSQREHRRPTWGLGETSKERHPGRCETDGALIDEKGNGMASAQCTGDATYSLVIVHDRHADPLPRPGQVSIEQWVLHVACHGLQRKPARRGVRATELPVPEVAGDDDESLLTRDALLDDAPPLHLVKQRDDMLRIIRGEERGLGRRAAEIGVARAGDATDFVWRELRQRGANLSFHDVATDGERTIAERPDARTDGAGATETEPAEQREHAPERSVLKSMIDRRRARYRRHRVAHRVRSLAAAAARSKPSIISDSLKSRCTRVRAALPIAERNS